MWGLLCPRMLKIPWEGNLPFAADPPARSPACGSSRFPVVCVHVACIIWLPGLVGVGSVPPSVRKSPSLAIFRKGRGRLRSRGVPFPMGLLECSPLTTSPRAQRLLSRLPRPAPPRSEFGEGSRGAGPVCRPAVVEEPCGSGCVVVGKGVCGTPSFLRGLVAAGWGAGRRRWAPGSHPVSRSSPVPSVACVPPVCVHDFGRSRGVGVCRAWCVPCALGLCGCRLVPPSSAASPRLAESREFLLPSSGPRVSVSGWRG